MMGKLPSSPPPVYCHSLTLVFNFSETNQPKDSVRNEDLCVIYTNQPKDSVRYEDVCVIYTNQPKDIVVSDMRA